MRDLFSRRVRGAPFHPRVYQHTSMHYARACACVRECVGARARARALPPRNFMEILEYISALRALSPHASSHSFPPFLSPSAARNHPAWIIIIIIIIIIRGMREDRPIDRSSPRSDSVRVKSDSPRVRHARVIATRAI